MIVLPDNLFFEFLLGEDQHFDIRFDKSDPVASLSFTGSEENSQVCGLPEEMETLAGGGNEDQRQAQRTAAGKPRSISRKERAHGTGAKMKQYLKETAEANRERCSVP
jgi:hypothetical protein